MPVDHINPYPGSVSFRHSLGIAFVVCTCTSHVDEVEESELGGDAAIAEDLRPIAFSARLVRRPLDPPLLILAKSEIRAS